MNYAKLHHKQAGMTLIELTVVLLILIGLAGLLVPYVGSFVQKTHDSTSSSNLAQLNNAMMRFTVEKNRLPHHLETLINDTASTAAASGSCATGQPNTAAGDIYCGMLDPLMFEVVDYAANTGSDAIAVESLRKGGLTMFVNNNPDTANKTFASTSGMYYLPGSGMNAMMIKAKFARVVGMDGTATPTAVRQHLAAALGGAGMDYLPECYDYLAFGIGDKNELIGNTMTAAPVHFPEDATVGPVQRYNHYLAIIQVDKANTGSVDLMGTTYNCSEATEKAKFLGTVMNTPRYPGSLLNGVGASLSYTYTNAVAEQ